MGPVHGLRIGKLRPSTRRGVAAVLLAGATCAGPGSQFSNGPLTQSLANGARYAALPVRLSLPTTLAHCERQTADSPGPCTGRLGIDARNSLLASAANATAALREEPTSDALQATALVDLLAGDTARIVIDRSISYLEMATRMNPNAVGALVDLSGAELIRANGDETTTALLRSLEASSRALQSGRPSAPALYNRALALEELGLDAEADRAWASYLSIDRTSPFAADARRRRTEIAAREQATLHASDDAGASSLTTLAITSPADAYAVAWEQLLPNWGRAILGGDSVGAAKAGDRLRAIGSRLAEMRRGESVALAMRSIQDASRSPASLRRLASAHVEFGAAQDSARRNRYVVADSLFRQIAADQPPSPVLLARARIAHANALVALNQGDRALALSQQLERELSTRTDPIAAGRARWIQAVVLLRQSRVDSGLAPLRRARSVFENAGDTEDAAGAVGFEGEALIQSGDLRAGLNAVRSCLLALRSHPTSLWRHNTLIVLSRAAARGGWPLAARAIEDEDLIVSSSGTRAVSVAEARLARARAFWTSGQPDSAAASLGEAEQLMRAIGDSALQARLGEDVRLTHAAGGGGLSPMRRRAMLDSVIRYFEPLRFPGKLIPAYIARAQSELAMNLETAAEHDLAAAADLYARQRDEVTRAAARAAVMAQARDVYAQLVRLRIHANRPMGALVAMEESRRFVGGLKPVDSADVASIDQNAIEWGLVGDSLLTWVISHGRVTFSERAIRRTELRALIERATAALELHLGDRAAQRELGSLYDLLIGPAHKAGMFEDDARPLVLVPDEELAAIPFAALWDAHRREYLVQERTIVISPWLSASVPHSNAHDVTDRGSTHQVFVGVAAPRVGSLSQLGMVDTETWSAARLFPAPRVLVDSSAAAPELLEELSTADLFHFAGHAVFDDAEPDRSYLALGDYKLFASMIAAQSWPNLRLAVLSACETSRSGGGDARGFLGLADSFIAAGARAVIGTLWSVDDAETRALMSVFYPAYRRTADPAGALRESQLQALRTGRVSPATWAAFRVVAP